MNSRMNYPGKMAVIANQYKKEKEYWLQKMSGTLVKSYFPYDFSIPGQHDQDNGKGFETLGLEFSPEFFLRLMEISKHSDYALYIILVSGLVSLLYKYTENKDIIVGAPIFKQAKEGKFINTVLAVCSRIEAAMTFKQLLTQVKESVLEADANMNFPIEILLNQLDIPYMGNDDFPLFDTMILLENIQEKNYISDINVNLKFYFRLKEKNIDGTVEYKPGRYRKETVQTVIVHYINLLEQALSNPHQPLSALDILAGQERERILYTFNNTAAGYPQDKTLHRLIAEQVERKPDQIAVVDRVKGKEDHRQSDTTGAVKTSPIQITYRELKEKSIPLEYALRQKGVEPDIIVGIMVERSIEMLTGILAILNAGGAYLPINPQYPPERIDFMLKDSSAQVLLVDDSSCATWLSFAPKALLNLSEGHHFSFPASHLPTFPPSLPSSLAYVIYTSGSTGRPKGMLIRHNNVVRLMVNDKYLFDFSSSDVWTLFHSYCFDFSVWEIFGALLYGGKLVIIKKMTAKDPGRFLKILKQEKVTVLNQTPQAFYNLIDAELKYETKELNLDYVIFGGEALKPVKLKSWRQKYPGVKLINMYGITETTVHVTYKEIKEREIHLNISNIGNPISTTTTYVMDQGLNLLPIGVSGELFVGGDGVGRGYLNMPELTYEKFQPNPYKPGEILYRSGDRVKLSHNGEMEYLGRIDHQVKIRGYRIEVEEIESHLLKHKDIKEAAVLSRENKDGSKYLCAYVTAVNNNKETGEGLANNLREFLLQKLPDYMIPSYFIRLDQFPLTVNGKLDRKALSEPNVDLETRYKAPTNEIQEKMAEAWQQVLGHEKIGIRNNFFKAGGDSINAITLISKLNDSLHADLLVADLYNYQTIEELSEQLVKNRIHYTDHDEFLEEAREDIQEFKKRLIEHNKMTDEIEDVYPMSDIEKGMVYHYLNDPQGAFYFEQNAYKVIYKDFNIETFKQALSLMVKKHPVLRTGFDVDDFAHVIYKSVSPVVSDYDISSMTEQEQRTYVLNYMEKSRKVMFQRLTPPLWRMAFFKPGNEYVIILMELHHAMLDGWSLSLFLTELERIYFQLKSQKQVNPGKLKCSYKEFITSETAVKKRIAAREYWKNELSGYKRFTFPPTGQEGKEYKEIEINSGRERLEQLQMTAAKHNTSLKHLCFAAYVYALGMFSYEDDIVLGLITNSRPICEDGDRLLGCFLNTIPVRMQIPTRIKWHEYIKQIDEKLIEIKKYDMMPFNEIVKIIEEKPGDQNPIFDCIFNYIDFYAYQGIQSENALVDTSVGSYIKTNTLLDFHVDVWLKTFQVFCDYSSGFISETYCKKLCTYFQEVLNKFIDEPEGYAIKSAIIPEREKHKILFEFNNTGAKYPEEKTIHRLFEEQVEKSPDSIAVIGAAPNDSAALPVRQVSLTYRELNEKSNRLAYMLIEKGVQHETIVGIMAERSFEMIMGILGILKSGGAYLPIDLDYPQERINYMLKDSAAKILVTTSGLPGKFEELSIFNCQLLTINEMPPGRRRLNNPPKEANNHLQLEQTHLAYVIYTSGSTGGPKGVLVEHRGVIRLVKNTGYIEFKDRDRILQTGALSFDVSTFEIWGVLLNGLGLVLLPKESILNPVTVKWVLYQFDISTIWMTTPLFNQMADADEEVFTGLRNLLVGGDILSPMHINRVRKKVPGLKIINGYGPTENTTFSTTFSIDREYKERIPIGKPITNSTAYIVDKNGSLQPIGIVGELLVGGDGVSRGYLNNPGLTREKFIFYRTYITGKLYKTGDLARWLADGNIEFLGRLDFQVKIRGNRIELGEIEKQLLTYQNIKEAVVTAKKDQKGNGYLCAYLVPTSISPDKHAFKLSGIREYLSRYLPEYIIPSHFVVLPGLPLTVSGKVDRIRLPEPEGIDLEPDTKYIASRDEIEKNLVDIWQQILGKNIIGIHDNFFELGGDSIKAIQIASRMHKAGYKIEIRDIFQQRRISDMAALVKKIERIADQSIITGTISLTPIQKWFFNNHPVDTHYFNQAMMLYIEAGEELPDQLVPTLFSKLQEHHDALRMSYKEIDGKIIQTGHGLEYPLSLAEYDFRGCGSAVQMLEQKADEIQASIDLEKGPLMKLGLFHMDDGHRLLMVIHHLVIDGVSWRILFEDLETLYMQYRRGEELSLPLKTDSFKTWSEKLHEYANDQSFLKEKLYWQNLAAHDLPVIKKDFPVETDYLKDKNTLSFTLNEEETSLLLTKANVAFGTEISDLLLTALGLGLKETFAIQRILIALEGHGREEIIKDVDITRTVGWFTSLYPVLLNFSYENDLSRQIKDIKENLHRMPNKGIGYGILKYLTVEEVTGNIDLTLKPQICFNYLGQFDTDIKQFSSFQIAKESPGNPRSLKGKQEYLFVVTGIVINNCLELTIEYNKNHFKLETIEKLLHCCQVNLKQVIAFCLDRETSELTPSDLDYQEFTIDELGNLFEQIIIGRVIRLTKDNISNIYTLSPMQEGMYFHYLYDKSSPAYFTQFSYRINGDLHVQLMEKSLNELFKRYDILRTVFMHKKGKKLFQVVLKESRIDFHYENISAAADKEDYLAKFKKNDRKRSFDLGKDVLMRASLIQLDKFEYEFTLSHHHILMDGWCVSIIIAELAEIYNSYLERRPYRLPEAKQYRIYIKWLESQDREAAREYWEKYLQHYEGTASIPGLGKNNNNYQNENYTVEWEQEKTKKLEKMAVKYQVTLNTIFQSVWGILLGKYNGKQDVVFGAVVSGRPAEIRDVESMIGLFINTIPVRIQYEEQSKFIDLLKHVQEKAVVYDSYSYYPLAQIQALTKLKQNLFDHIIAFENYPAAEQIDSLMTGNREWNFKVSNVEIFEQTTYDFNIQVGLDQRLTINFLYNANIAGNNLIRRVANHLVRLLEQVIDNEEVIIDRLSFLSETEKNMILYEINDTTAGYPANKTIHELFAEQVAKTPDNTALILGNEQLTYNQLDKNALQWARILRDNGAAEDHIIGLILERSLEMIIVIMAVLKAGGAYLPIDANYPPNRITFMLKDSHVELIVSRRTRVNHVSLPARTIYLEDKLTSTPGTANLQSISHPHSMAYIIYTSGTTGKPKGVIVENRNVVRLMMNDRFQFDFNTRDTWTLFHSYSFDFSVWEMYGTLLYGGKLVIVPEMVAKDPGRFLALLKKWGVTVLNQTPSAFYNLQDEELKTGTRHLHLKYVIFGGEALKPVKLKQWKDKYPGTRLINMFGITETTVHVTYKEITGKEISLSQSNIGRPIPTLRLYIMDKNHHVLPVGVSGELCVGGLGPARGYLNRIELSGMKFVPNPYITGDKLYKSGDRGRLLDNGDIEYLGRIDNQMQLRGFRIELGEIENQLLGYKDIKECVVLVKENEDEHQYLCAYIVPGKQIVSSKLRDYLSKRLPSHMIPNYFVPIEKIPLTLNGKVNRHALPEPLTILEKQDAPPRNEIEEKLLQIWQKELAVDNISIKDSFFNLGGDSIKAIGLLSVINKALNSNLKIEDIFINNTIERLSGRISAATREKYDKEREAAVTEIEELKKRILSEGKLNGNIEDIYSMSDIQIGMIYYADKYLDKAMYFQQFTFQTKIPHFELDTFKRALNLITDKQPMLRTGFNLKDFEQPVQIVYKNAEIDVKYRDISDKSIEDQEKYITQFMENERQNPFIISLPALLKVVVFESFEENFIFMWEFHHVIADGWSFASFITEVNNTYFILKSNPYFIPGKLKCSYKDFVIEQIAEKKNKAAVEFWKNELDSYKRFDFSLLKDDKNSTAAAYTKKTYSRSLEKTFSQNLLKAARENDISLKNIFFAAYAYMLQVVSYENDFVTGLISHNRPTREDSEKIFGCFLNTIPVRIKIPPNLTWQEYIRFFDQKIIQLKKYERLSLFEICRIIGETSREGNPLFDTIFSFMNFHVYEQLIKDGQVNQRQDDDTDRLALGKHENTNTLFDFVVDTSAGNFKIDMIYSDEIFRDEQVDRLFGYFKSVLTNILTRPGHMIKKDELISREEKEKLLYQFNDTGSEYPGNKTIHQLFAEQANKTQDQIAVQGPSPGAIHECSLQLTFGELNEESHRLALAIIRAGVKPDSIVGIMAERSIEMVIGILGILKAGGAYLPIDPEYPRERIDFMLKDSGAIILLSAGRHHDPPASQLPSFSQIPSFPISLPSSLAYIIYTSGTTGRPKGVLVEHRNAVNVVCWFGRSYLSQPNTHVLMMSGYTFDPSVNQVFGSLLHGAVLYILNKELLVNLEKLRQYIEMHQIHVVNFVPAAFNELLGKGKKLSSIRVVLSGGERLDDVVKNNIIQKGYMLYNQYGPTETTIDALVEKCSKQKVTLGKPISNVSCYIFDKYNHLVPMKVAGELYIGGAGVARGYLNSPELTAEKFRLRRPGGTLFEGTRGLAPLLLKGTDKGYMQSCNHASMQLLPHHPPHYPITPLLHYPIYGTGDLARWLPEGNIEYLGRIDNQVKIRGFRIELGEIENRLLKYEKVKEAVVILKEDKSGDRFLCAYITSNGEISIASLRTYLKDNLPGYMIPAHFIKLDKLPLTPNGKIDRKALPGFAAISEIVYAGPRDAVENELAAIWAQVLGIEKEKISIDANFFEIGGHSLKAVILIAKIHKAFDIKLQLSELFKKPTIRELSVHIKGGTVNQYRSLEFAELKEYYPLSSPQKRLFILHQFDRESTGYNMAVILRLEGKIHKQEFEKTFIRLLERHESLRTSFALVGNESVQVIHGDIAFNIEYFQGPAEPIIKDFIRPFDLAKAPLIRVGLIRTAADRHVFIVDMHHIIADGVSLGIMVRNFMSIYAGERISPLKLQYKEYSQWQNRESKKGEIAKQENYWLEQFEGGIPVLELPTDFNRPPVQSFAGNSVNFQIDEKQRGALNRLALETGCTLYMVLFALYSIFLAKISNQEDIVIGSPTAGRNHADLESIIGIFLNTLPLRTGPVSSQTFAGYVSNLKETILTAFENQDYPYEDLVKNVSVDRDMSRNPLFDVMFILQSMDAETLEIPGLKISPYQYEYTSAKFDLTLIASEEEEKIYFTLEYCTALFRESTARGFVQYFKNTINAALQDPGIKIAGIEIITPGEKKRVLFDFNNTRKEYPGEKTIHELFAERASIIPDKIALVFENAHLTYKELHEKVNSLARLLKSKGVAPNRVVGLSMERSLEMITGIYGILEAGGAYLPCDPNYPENRVKYMFEKSETRLLLSRGGLVAKYRDMPVQGEVIDIDASYAHSVDKNRIHHINRSNDLAYLIFTSGSTGNPKGIMIEHKSVVNFIEGIADIIDFSPGKTILAVTTISFDIFVLETLLPLAKGLKVVIAAERQQNDPDLLSDIILKNKVNMVQLTPSRLKMLIAVNRLDCLKEVRELMVGGEAFPGDLLACLQKSFKGKIFNMYGPTETTVWSTVKDLTLSAEINIGTPIANTYVYILDKNHNLQPIGITGELGIGGAGTARGYLNNPTLTAEKFTNAVFKQKPGPPKQIPHPGPPIYYRSCIYKTGDLARWLPDGNIDFLGRVDEQVKIRGFRIETGEIEGLLLKRDGIKEVVVTTKDDSMGNKCLCAYYISDMELSVSDLRKYCSGSLPEYMIPSYFMRIEKFPLTPNGKIHRKLLPHPEIKTGAPAAAPRNETEKKLVEIWCGVLAVQAKHISIDTNFFELGGHSLSAVILISMIHKELAVKVPLTVFFKNPNIRDLSQSISGMAKDIYISISPVERKEYYPLSSAQKRLYVIQQMEPENLVYNFPQTFTWEGKLHREKLEQSFKQLTRRHMGLRTSFLVVEEETCQRIYDETGFKIEYYEMNGGDPGAVIKQFIRPFDLSKPPIRVGLARIEENKHLLMLDMHHIITDFVSNRVLVDDFAAIYEEELLPALRLQYTDFSQWHNELLKSGQIKKQERYWSDVFKEEVPPLNLPTDFSTPDVTDGEGRDLAFTIENEKYDMLDELRRQTGTTFFVLLLTIYYILLYKYTGKEDIVIANPTASRYHPDLEGIIGVFINMLAMRNRPQGNKTFSEFINEVKENTLTALENQDFQFDELVKKLGLQRNTKTNPLNDCVFNYIDVRTNEERKELSSEIKISPYAYERNVNPFNLLLIATVTENMINMMLTYPSLLFKRTTMEKMSENYMNIINQVSEDREIRLADIKLSHDLFIVKSSVQRKEESDFNFIQLEK